jgi:hypothetical protein
MKLQSDILALSKPDRRSWKATRKIFKNYDPRARKYQSEMIGGEMMSHLDNEHKHDLCVLAPPVERDRLTKLLEGRLAWIFRVSSPVLVSREIVELIFFRNRNAQLMGPPTMFLNNASKSS